ncbi:MAG: TatD family hydrolase [Paramuribaculum sp.]|nr:TatD family hydrolase [Paramuribaculum sp.]
MLVDTHTHLYLPQFTENEGGKAVVERAIDAGVSHLIFPNVDLTTIAPMRSLHALFPHHTSMAMGLHPTEITDDWQEHLSQIKEHLESDNDYIAVGEIGMDLYWDTTFREQQMLALREQMQWAREKNLPVIIHCREALDPTLEVLSEFPDSRGVMHSFGGTPAEVERIRKYVDYYFGINGIVTFKNSHLTDTLPAIGKNRILLETDSPYLAPVPYRGRRNESAYIKHIADTIATTLHLTQEEISDVTTVSATSLFPLPV